MDVTGREKADTRLASWLCTGTHQVKSKWKETQESFTWKPDQWIKAGIRGRLQGMCNINISLTPLWNPHRTKAATLNLDSVGAHVPANVGHKQHHWFPPPRDMWNTNSTDTETKLVLACLHFPMSFCIFKLPVYCDGQARHL